MRLLGNATHPHVQIVIDSQSTFFNVSSKADSGVQSLGPTTQTTGRTPGPARRRQFHWHWNMW